MLAPWKKGYDKPASILKSRDVTLPTKVRIVKAIVFPVVMYGYESWSIKKAEHQRTDAFELWHWEDSWESLDYKIWPVNPKGNQPWKFIARNKYWCSSWSSHTSATWCKEMTHWKRPWCSERLKAGEGDEMVGWHHRLKGRVWVNSGSWWCTGKPGVLQSTGSQRVGHNWATEPNCTWSPADEAEVIQRPGNWNLRTEGL